MYKDIEKYFFLRVRSFVGKNVNGRAVIDLDDPSVIGAEFK